MSDSAPPVYNPVSTSDNDTEDKPPSYFNVISQLKAAKAESKSPVDLGQKTLAILFGSCKSKIFRVFLKFIF